jgi:type III secretion protein R
VESLPNPALIIMALITVSLAPFVAVMVSSYIKIVVVVFLVRNALGIQQIPPNMAVNGLAIILSMYIMAPIGVNAYENLTAVDVELADFQQQRTQQAFTDSLTPLKAFLKKHSQESQRDFFARTTKKLWPEEQAKAVTGDHVLVLLPSFIISQLTSAFQIGFLLYLPFIVIDLIISNILLSMGMLMVSPMTISLPFKLLLFVLVDGWTRLIHGLVLTYQ